MDSILSVQDKNFSGRKRVPESFSSRRKRRKSFTLTIHRNLANPVKIFHGIIVLPHLIDLRRMELPKEQCAESQKERQQYSCNLAWMKNGGRILWNASATFEMFRTSWQLGKHLMRESENHSKGPVIPFGSLEECHLISARDQSRLHPFGKKVLPGRFLGYAFHRGEGRNLERRHFGRRH